jgi:hypothetical protein
MARSAANSKLNGTFICWANASEGATRACFRDHLKAECGVVRE